LADGCAEVQDGKGRNRREGYGGSGDEGEDSRGKPPQEHAGDVNANGSGLSGMSSSRFANDVASISTPLRSTPFSVVYTVWKPSFWASSRFSEDPTKTAFPATSAEERVPSPSSAGWIAR